MQLPMPQKVQAALQIMQFYDTVEFAENVNHPARRLTSLEAACRDSAIKMMTYWFMGEIDLEPPLLTKEALDAEMERQSGRGPSPDDDDDEVVFIGED